MGMMMILTMLKMIMMMGKVTSRMSISETCKTMLMNTSSLKDISIMKKMMEVWMLMMYDTTKSLIRVERSSKINDDANDEKTLPTMIRCRSVCKSWE